MSMPPYAVCHSLVRVVPDILIASCLFLCLFFVIIIFIIFFIFFVCRSSTRICRRHFGLNDKFTRVYITYTYVQYIDMCRHLWYVYIDVPHDIPKRGFIFAATFCFIFIISLFRFVF